LPASLLIVRMSGAPILSMASAISASSGARDESTISQKACVFGGGAFGSKNERS
jgi:hypothetical protein